MIIPRPKCCLLSLKTAYLKRVAFGNRPFVPDQESCAVIGKKGIKGEISVGADADLMVLSEDLDIVNVMAKGRVAVLNGSAILKRRFEK